MNGREPDTVNTWGLIQEENMADLRNYQTRPANAGVQAGAVIDEGLRSYMLRVYNLMAFGLAITGLVAYFASQAGYAVNFGALFAAVVITVLPVLVTYIIFQRQLQGSVSPGLMK